MSKGKGQIKTQEWIWLNTEFHKRNAKKITLAMTEFHLETENIH